MIIERIKSNLLNKGFREVKVNIPGIYLLYYTAGQDISLVAFFDCPCGMEFTTEQYENIQSQLYRKYIQRGFTAVHIQTVICTRYVDIVRKLQPGDQHEWIIDLKNNQLIIYENQNSDFLGIRKDIEDILLDMQLSQEQIPTSYGLDNSQVNTRDHQPVWAKYFAKYNTIIILINIIVFFITERKGYMSRSDSILDMGALYWPAVWYHKEYYRLLTYMFLHGGIQHLGNNMIVLFIIGDNMERAVGKWKYLLIYFGSGVLAGLASMGYNMLNNINTVSIGASGAIFGVVGAMAYIVVLNKGHLEDLSTRQIILFVIFSLYGGLTSQGVDNAAHIGGLVAGIILAAVLYRKRKKSQPERG
ncbi:MAG: Rhomboid protease GluP [Lachnoclostridium sp.]|jgi:rhomboid protease GluP